MNWKKTQTSKVGLFLAGIFFSAACSVAATEAPTTTNSPVPPTETAMPPTSTDVPPTDTAVPTDTSEPTATPTETPNLAATAAYESTEVAAQVETVIYGILAVYNVSPESGYLAWNESEPFHIAYSGGGSGGLFQPIDEGAVYDNYVLHTSVTWDSDTGYAGCGIIFHSEQNLASGAQYQFGMLRLSGLPAWDVELWQFGAMQAITTGDLKFNGVINQESGSTNEIVMVITDGLMTIYANEVRLSNVIITTRSEGRIGYYLFQESGATSCIFADNWIWVLED